ncbi:hypothetical protein [uncultured Aquimarina sp.]|uniref:hypothetical protein n=1 Tax=uncultured Aquimarina sp. TaxID=575652 RepID=UPI002607CB94|nr:hypothetical protein [uncultured Aquimarina sp.]
MKFIYKILMLGMVCLISTKSFAQFQSTPDPDKPVEAKSNSIAACICAEGFPEEYERFRQILAQKEAEERQQWLVERQLAQKAEIERRLRKTYPNFRTAQTDFLKERIYKNPSNRIVQQLISDYGKTASSDKSDVNQKRISLNAVNHRRNVSDFSARTIYGDLKIDGDLIRDYSGADVIYKVNQIASELNNIHKPKANASSKIKNGLPKVLDRELLIDRMVHLSLARYDSYNVEDKVKVMTKYLIQGQFFSVDNYALLEAAPPYMFNVNDPQYNGRQIAINYANDIGIPDTLPDPSETGLEAVKLHAIISISSDAFNYAYSRPPLKDELGKFMGSQFYSDESIANMRRVVNPFVRGQNFNGLSEDLVSFNTPPTFQSESNKELALSWRSDNPATSLTNRGLGNVMHHLYNSVPRQFNLEGNTIRQAFNFNGLNVPNNGLYSDENLGRIFDFGITPYGGKPGPGFYYNYEIIFKPSIGAILWQQGITIQNMFTNPLHMQAAINYANGVGGFDLEFEQTLAQLNQMLDLNISEVNSLRQDKPDSYRIIDHLSDNVFNEQALFESRLYVFNGHSVTPWSPSIGAIEDNPFFSYNATRVHTYKDGQQVTEFRLNNGDFIARGDYANCAYCSESYQRTMYMVDGGIAWYDIVVPRATSTSAHPFNFVIDKFWDGAKLTGRYLLPLEDALILVDGRNFDGEINNRYLAGGFLAIGLIPGGKLLKPVKNIIKGSVESWTLVLKVGDDTVELIYKVGADGVVSFGPRNKLAELIIKAIGEEAHHILPWADRIQLNEVVQEAAYAGFHMSSTMNGRPLKKFSSLTPDGIHGNHPAYTDVVEFLLNQYKNSVDVIDPVEAAKFIEKNLIPRLNIWIDEAIDSTLNLNEFFKQVVKPRVNFN